MKRKGIAIVLVLMLVVFMITPINASAAWTTTVNNNGLSQVYPGLQPLVWIIGMDMLAYNVRTPAQVATQLQSVGYTVAQIKTLDNYFPGFSAAAGLVAANWSTTATYTTPAATVVITGSTTVYQQASYTNTSAAFDQMANWLLDQYSKPVTTGNPMGSYYGTGAIPTMVPTAGYVIPSRIQVAVTVPAGVQVTSVKVVSAASNYGSYLPPVESFSQQGSTLYITATSSAWVPIITTVKIEGYK
jgi:hypothetical protein